MLFGITGLCGTSRVGGTAITTVSLSYSADGTTGMPAGGTQRGVTHPKPITLMMARSTLITICRRIRLLPTSRSRCNSKGIVGATSMACSDLFHARRSQLTSVTTDCTKPRRLIARPWNRWEWPDDNSYHGSCGRMTPAAAFRVQKNVDGRRPLGSAADKDVNHPSAALPAQRSGYNAGRRK